MWCEMRDHMREEHRRIWKDRYYQNDSKCSVYYSTKTDGATKHPYYIISEELLKEEWTIRARRDEREEWKAYRFYRSNDCKYYQCDTGTGKLQSDLNITLGFRNTMSCLKK